MKRNGLPCLLSQQPGCCSCPSLSAHAQAADLYKAKCAMCHGADGKKAAGHDFTSADVQKKSDADLTAVITDGKAPRCPSTGQVEAGRD